MKDFVLGHEISSHEQALAAMVDCQQVLFHQNARNHLILVFTREILMLDLDIGQTVSNPMDLNYRFPFMFTKKMVAIFICISQTVLIFRPPFINGRPQKTDFIFGEKKKRD